MSPCNGEREIGIPRKRLGALNLKTSHCLHLRDATQPVYFLQSVCFDLKGISEHDFFQNVQSTLEPVDSMVYKLLYIWHIPLIIHYRLSQGQTMTHVTILMSKDLSLFLMLSLGNSLKVREALKLLWNSGFKWPPKRTVHTTLGFIVWSHAKQTIARAVTGTTACNNSPPTIIQEFSVPTLFTYEDWFWFPQDQATRELLTM
jgi:hypothetical protein